MSPDPTPTARDRVVALLTTLEQLDATCPVRDLLGPDLCDRLVAVLATAGTVAEAEHPAVRALREALGYAGDDWPLVSSHITDRLQVVKETVATLEPWPVRAASPRGEAQGQGEGGDPA